MTGLCDNCNYITDIVYREEKLPNDIKHTYFDCEHCYHRYTCFVTDSKVRKMQRKKPSLVWDKRLELQEQINQRMSHLKHNLVNFGRADL